MNERERKKYAMATEKVYCGIGRLRKTKFGDQVKISQSREDLDKLYSYLDDKGWVSSYLNERRKPSKDQTHYLTIALPKRRPDNIDDRDDSPPVDDPEDVEDTSDTPF